MSDARRLFDAFRAELDGDRVWDSEFTPSPFGPGATLRDFVDGADAAEAEALLLEALCGDRRLRYWACVGLGWLGPAAGTAAADALADLARQRGDALPEAAVALDAVAPDRARALGVHRWPETMAAVADRHADEFAAYVARFVAEEADDDIARLLRHRLARDVADVVAPLLAAGRSPTVRRATAEILVLAAVHPVTEDLIEALGHGDPPSVWVIAQVAPHPASDRLLPRLAGPSAAALITRRRCAGLSTDPGPVHDFARHGEALPDVLAGLRDAGRLELLIPMLRTDRPSTDALGGLVRAIASFGAAGRALLDREPHPWVVDLLARRPPRERRLELADDAFRRGRIESTLGGAFTAYADLLLPEPSAHPAFQLAWIDRAFGAPVTAGRIAWIRDLGFADEGLLAELGRPVRRALPGYRFQWDPGERRRDDPVRAARAADAGLPSLAARWHRDDALERAAAAHVERVRRASR